MISGEMPVENSIGKMRQFPPLSTVFTDSPSTDQLSHITALDGLFEIKAPLNKDGMNVKCSGKTA
jgi:hypothetical protein